MSSSLLAYTAYIDSLFSCFISRIVDDYDVPESELRAILNSVSTLSNPTIPLPVSGKPKKKATPTPEEDEETGECVAQLKSGARKGEMCGKKISDKSETRKYCGMHVKLESSPEALKKKEEEDLGGFVFLKNRHDRYTFGETGLILQSEEDQRIIGKQYHDGTIVDLDEDDIALCQLRRLKYVEKYSKK